MCAKQPWTAIKVFIRRVVATACVQVAVCALGVFYCYAVVDHRATALAMFFSGKPSQQRKVALGGRSRGEETREQVLERTRAEREKRSRNKLETKSALAIQTHWRQLCTARKFHAELRQNWARLCGTAGSRQALQQAFASDPKLLSALLYCYDAKQPVDREALAAVCAGLSSTAGAAPLLSAAAAGAAGMSSRSSNRTAADRASPTAEQLALFRVQKLSLLCLSTLAAGGAEAAAALSSPYASLPTLLQQQGQPMAAMLDFLIKVANPQTWKKSDSSSSSPGDHTQQQQQADAAGAEAVLRHLFSRQLMGQLRMLLSVMPPGCPSKTCAEVCVTQYVVRAIKLQLLPVKQAQQPQGLEKQQAVASTGDPFVGAPPQSPAAAAGSADTAATAAEPAGAILLGASQLLCVSGLWAKAASLVPVAGRLCGAVLGEVRQLQDSKQLTDALLRTAAAQGGDSISSRAGVLSITQQQRQQQSADGAAAAAVALVENFIEAAAAGTLGWGTSQAEQVTSAGRLVGVLVLLLESAKQLSLLQRRSKLNKRNQQQQQGAGRSIYDTGSSGAGVSRKAGYVPGAGFVASKGAGGPAEMDLDPSPGMVAVHPEAATAAEAAVPAAAAAAQGAVAAAAGVEGAAAAAMDVDHPPAALPGTANAAAGASTSPPRASRVAAADAAVLEQPVAASAWSAEANSSSSGSSSKFEVSATEGCLQLLAGSTKGQQILKLLVATLLPATTAAESRALRQQQQPPPTADGTPLASPTAAAGAATLLPGCQVQQQLLELIWGLSRAPEYRQKVWLGLGVRARLVPRLWYSLVLPLHLSTPGGLLYYTGGSSSSGSRFGSSGSSPGFGQQQDRLVGGGAGSWVVPLLVLCQAFNAALSFTHVEDFYAAEGASCLVPLSQLYDAAAPAAGLVLLVKSALWQVLWFNSVSPPGLPPPPPGAPQAQQQLKSAVAEVCGLLLCQLHDRNCLRQFCTPSAFLCELATAAPARLQQEVAAAAVRMGAQEDSGEDEMDGTDDSAWQQQQQWQQQRQQGLGPLAVTASAGVDGDGGRPDSRGNSTGGSGSTAAAAGGVDADAAAWAGAGGGRSPGSRVWVVLEHAPCLVPFELRVQLLQHVLELEKSAAVESGEVMHMWDDPMEAFQNRFVTIRRDELMEDGFSQIGRMDPDRVKGRLRIQYVNEAGLPEAGIDGGGLFKDFMEELLRQGFSPQSHLMAENPQHQLYPNPAAFANYADAEHRLGFLGRMLGKCLYEGMLLELPLAAFFLKKMRGGVCDINDMPSLDPEVYKHLLQLRHYQGDFAELSLNFTATVVEQSANGSSTRQREIELKPGGLDTSVKADNVIEYIHRLADFRLNRQMDRAAAAFLRGFFELIKPRWVRMFNEAELQMLISGSEEGIDVDDLMQHISYAGGYHEEHPVIIVLWETLRGFTPQQQRQFLKFVTSCSRAPLLGFAYLEPRMCVQMSGGMLQPGATERLPTAATCMNLLKLPPYRTVKQMREKLLYAISAGAGFELS